MAGWLLAVAAGSFWAGILVASLGMPGISAGRAGLLLAAGLSVGVLAILPRGHALSPGGGTLAVVMALGLLGAGWGGLREARVRASPLAGMAGLWARVEGGMTSDPRPGRFGWTATMDADLVDAPGGAGPGTLAVHDALRLEGRGPPPMLRTGDQVTAEGTLIRPGVSFGSSLIRLGYAATLRVDDVRLRGPPANPLARAADAVRSAVRASVGRVLPRREGGLLLGLALGDMSRSDPEVEEDFRATGMSHLTAVSGANLAMFLGPILGLATWAGLGRTARLVGGVLAVGFFVLLTRAEPSVLRAAAMTGLAMWGVFLGRPRTSQAIVGGAVLMLLAVNPTLVHAVGFQLSVGATAGIAMLATPVSSRLRFLPTGLALAAGTTLGAQAAVMPILLYHFGVVPVVALPANLLAFPVVGAGMMLGLAAALVGAVSDPLGAAVGWVARWPLAYLIGVADRMARAPLPSITSPGGRVLDLFVGLGAVVVLGWWVRSGRRMPRRSVIAVVLVVPVVVWLGAIRAGSPQTLTVTFFDVGQGDAALLRSPAGANVLVDGGPEPDEVSSELAALGVRRLDLVVATHPHADHVAGLSAVLSRFGVGLVLDPGCGGESPVYQDFLRSVASAGVPVRHPRTGSILTVGDLRIEVVGPEACHRGTESDENNDSLVLRISIGRASLLFPGDVEEPAQAEMLDGEAGSLRALVLKVPHHGGDTSLRDFIYATDAIVAIVSVGEFNRYGHPAPDVLMALRQAGMRILRTDRSGDLTVTFHGDHVSIQSSAD